MVFRRAYDAIQAHSAGTKGDLEFLRILHQAAGGSQADVETALLLLLEEGKPFTAASVKELLEKEPAVTEVPALDVLTVDLNIYDQLLTAVAA